MASFEIKELDGYFGNSDRYGSVDVVDEVVGFTWQSSDYHIYFSNWDFASNVSEPFETIKLTQGATGNYISSISYVNQQSFLISWTSHEWVTGYDYDVSIGAYSLSSDSFTNANTLNKYTANHQTDSEIVQLGENRYLVTWTSAGQDGQYSGVFANVLNELGLPLLDEEIQLNENWQGAQYKIEVIETFDGATVFWWDDWQTKAQKISTDGLLLDTNKNVDLLDQKTISALDSGGYVSIKANSVEIGILNSDLELIKTINVGDALSDFERLRIVEHNENYYAFGLSKDAELIYIGFSSSGIPLFEKQLIDSDINVQNDFDFEVQDGVIYSIYSTYLSGTQNEVKYLRLDLNNSDPTGTVTITGTTIEGQVLTVDTSSLSDADGLGNLSYQWLRDGSDISGATSATYTLAQADVGAAISARTSYTDGGGTAESVASASTNRVAFDDTNVAQTFVISVAPATSGSGNRYVIDGVEAPALQLEPGKTYAFDLSDASTLYHPLDFNLGSADWTLDVTTFGDRGTDQKIYVSIPQEVSGDITYYCTNHSGMGNAVAVQTPNSATFYVTETSNGIEFSGTADGPITITFDSQGVATFNRAAVVGADQTTLETKTVSDLIGDAFPAGDINNDIASDAFDGKTIVGTAELIVDISGVATSSDDTVIVNAPDAASISFIGDTLGGTDLVGMIVNDETDDASNWNIYPEVGVSTNSATNLEQVGFFFETSSTNDPNVNDDMDQLPLRSSSDISNVDLVYVRTGDVDFSSAFVPSPLNLDAIGGTISDTTAPTVSIAMSDQDIKVGDTSTVTFTFSEAPTGFTADDVTVANGAIADLKSQIAVGDEFQANTNTFGNQAYPSVSSLSDGGFVVTWDSSGQDGDISGIFGQRYDSSGVAAGEEFQINTHTDGSLPSVSSLSDGGFVVTWARPVYGNIYGQRFDNSWNKTDGEFLVNTEAEFLVSTSRSSVTSLTDGGFVVTWDTVVDTSQYYNFSNPSGSIGIYGQQYDGSGNKVGDKFQVDSSGDTPSVTSLNGGGFVVTWNSYGQQYDGSSNKIGDRFQIDSSGFEPHVTSLQDGGFVVTFLSLNQDGSVYGISGQRYDSSSSKVGDKFQVDSSLGYNPSVTSLNDGGFVVTWHYWPTHGISGQLYDSSGSKVGDKFQVSSGETSSVTALGGDGFVVTWQPMYDADGNGISVQRYEGAGLKVYAAAYTPETDVEDATNVISVGTDWTDAAENAPVGATDSSNYAVDTLRPTVSIAMSDDALKVGDTSTVTFTFSEAPTGFTAEDVTVANGTISDLTVTADAKVHTAIYTPTADVEDATNVISVGTDWTDAAGNAPAGATDSSNYAVDTLRPTISIAMSDEALKVGDTSMVTFTFSETPTGFTADDVTVANGALSDFTVTADAKVYTATYTPTADVEDTTNVISVGTDWTDAAGNAPTATTDSSNYAVDTRNPNLTVTSADTTSGLSGAAEAGAAISVTITDPSGSSRTLNATADDTNTGAWNISYADILGSEVTSDDNGTYAFSVTASDAAGNSSEAATASLVVDEAAPNQAPVFKYQINAFSYNVDYAGDVVISNEFDASDILSFLGADDATINFSYVSPADISDLRIAIDFGGIDNGSITYKGAAFDFETIDLAVAATTTIDSSAWSGMFFYQARLPENIAISLDENSSVITSQEDYYNWSAHAEGADFLRIQTLQPDTDYLISDVPNFSKVHPITISGELTAGADLTVSIAAWIDPDGTDNTTFEYQWLRDGSDISGATSATYTLAQADVGAAISVRASYTDDGGTFESVTSTTTQAIAPNSTTAPTIDLNDADGTIVAYEVLNWEGLSGTADPNSTLTLISTYVTTGMSETFETTATSDGKWSVDQSDVVEVPPDGQFNLSVTSKDVDGNVSDPVTASIIFDLTTAGTDFNAPTVDLNDADGILFPSQYNRWGEVTTWAGISGTATASSTVIIVMTHEDTGAKITGLTQADINGDWSLPWDGSLEPPDFDVSFELTVTYTDNVDKISAATTKTLTFAAPSADVTPTQDVVGGLNIEQLSKDGDVVTYGLIADAGYDPGGDGIGALDIKTINFDPTDFDYVEGSLTSDHFGSLLVPNELNASNGVVAGVGIGLAPFTDFDAPIAEFQMTVLDTSQPVSISITGTLFDGDEAPDTIETFDYTSSTLTATVITRDGTAMDGVTVTASDSSYTTDGAGQTSFELSNGSDVVVNASLDFENVSPTNAINAMDALQALRIAVGLETSNGPATYEDYIASDFDASGSVNAMDALGILKYAVGLDAPDARWVFIDSDGDYSDVTQSSVTYDTGISLEAFAADASVSLTGILVGDIDDSYSGLIA